MLLVALGFSLLGLSLRLIPVYASVRRLDTLRREAEAAPETVLIRAAEPAGEAAQAVGPNEKEALAAWEKYRRLRAQNEDCYGWLTVPDTPVDDPLMFTPQEPEYYLRRDFTGAETAAGTLFLDGNSKPDVSRANLILYGHNMRDGSRFGSLKKYLDEAYFNAHPRLLLAGEAGVTEYEAVAVIPTELGGEREFPFYRYACIREEAAYLEYGNLALAASLHACRWTPRWGETLLTLVTCAQHAETGRLLVIARETGRSFCAPLWSGE